MLKSPSNPLAPAEPLGREPIRVFVHLARGYGATQWQARHERGEIIGLNERLPYGYFLAQESGCIVEYSEDDAANPLAEAFRLTMRLLLGFDLVHAWRNRRGIFAADIVWTGTESQFLAVLLLLRGRKKRHRPKVVAQNIWLFDTWPRLWIFKRWLYRRLIADAAALTAHSEEGVRAAREFFPRQRSLFMPYGIRAEKMVRRRKHAVHRPIRILSAGSDRHRDWATLLAALSDWPEVELRIVAPRLSVGLSVGDNVLLVSPKKNGEYVALYRWADIVALSLFPNLHGSGITVIEEATVLGVPVIATDTGGLRGYFGDDEIRYVPAADPAAFRRAITSLIAGGEGGRMVERAQRRMIEAGLTSRGFASRHVELSRELLYGVAAAASETAASDDAETLPQVFP